LSLASAVLHAVVPKRGQTEITTLIDQVRYPKSGPGLMWERARDLCVASGAEIEMSTRVDTIKWDSTGATAVVAHRGAYQVETPASAVISSIPLPELARALEPPAPDHVLAATAQLRHRDFLTVALVVPLSASFPDNWIYIHSPDVMVGRVQNFGSWSPYLVKEGRTCLGLEYFVNEGDDMWQKSDDDLAQLATRELTELGLVKEGQVEAAYVVRMPKAYPVYDEGYATAVETIRAWMAEHLPNVYPVGRNGMHKYNNQDQSMMTAMLVVENLLLGTEHDIWAVNVEEDYHEATTASVPRPRSSGGTGREAPVLPRPSN
jgi:protoporphyrinogen oxidase